MVKRFIKNRLSRHTVKGCEMDSLWTKTTQTPVFPPLTEDLKTDVLIIGGGLAGLLSAYMLQNVGVDCALVEAGKICGGVTKNTTAKITSQHGLIYHQLIRRFNAEHARLYWQANEAALDKYRALCKNIDCDFEEKSAYVYAIDNPKSVERELNALHTIGVKADFVKDLPLPFSVAGAVKFEKQAQFHPLKFAYAISRGLRIFEDTKVLKLAPHAAITNRGNITAKKTIVATHFPFLNKRGLYFLKMFQHRSYVLALKNAPKVNGLYLDENEKGLSFRDHGEYLLLGGGSHRTGEKGGNFTELSEFADRYYPKAKPVYRWATQDCMTLDGVPYIGQYSKHTPDLYVATGFNKWGMTSSMVAADILTDEILGKENAYAQVFSPSRTIFRKQLAVNGAKAVLHLLTPTAPRCPHMGCALKYNREERSWDCPCHGSRFTDDGTLTDNPAMDDL